VCMVHFYSTCLAALESYVLQGAIVCVQRNKLFYFGWLCPLIGVHLIFCVLAYVFCMSVLPTNKLLDK
jgi:hypothetical protein